MFYKFEKINSVFPLRSDLGASLILRLWSVAFIIGWSLKEVEPYFDVREMIHMKF